MAACATCCAIVSPFLSIERPLACSGRLNPLQKKADVAEHAHVFNHVGLLVTGPPATAGLPIA
jgi:hypothetical protein